MEMERREFVVFILAVLYPLLADRMQGSYKPESPEKPQPASPKASASVGILAAEVRLAASGDTEIGGEVTPPTLQRRLIET